MEKVLIYPLSINDVYISSQLAVACSEPTVKTPETGVFIVSSEQI